MFKKTLIATLVLAAAGAANAGMYQCKPGDVTVPCEMSAWDVGAEALWFTQRQGEMNDLLPDQFYDYKWGFRIEASWHWGTGNDFNINWMHYNNSTSNVVTEAQRVTAGLPGAGAGDGTVVGSSKFDVVNIEFGQHVDFGEVWDVRFHGGVQGAYLENGLGGNNFWPQEAEVLKVSGWGPRGGADLFYNFDNGLSFFSKGAFSVLSSRANTTTTTGANGNALGSNGGRRLAITETEYKLGGQYVQPLAQGDLTWKLAWEAHNFINATPTGTNLAWDGIAFGLHWLGMA